MPGGRAIEKAANPRIADFRSAFSCRGRSESELPKLKTKADPKGFCVPERDSATVRGDLFGKGLESSGKVFVWGSTHAIYLNVGLIPQFQSLPIRLFSSHSAFLLETIHGPADARIYRFNAHARCHFA